MATATITDTVQVHRGAAVIERLGCWQAALGPAEHPAHDLRWLACLARGLSQEPLAIEIQREGRLAGLLPLALVASGMFGRFLVSLPYVNSAGPLTDDDDVAHRLVDRAVELARELNVRYLELRDERPIEHPALTERNTSKVHMRLALPATPELLLASFKSKLRSQLKGHQKNDFQIAWGSGELLPEFYDVFSRNMRDLGTPVYPRQFFAAILDEFAGQAELCVTRLAGRAVAAALLIHGRGISEVPSASSLRQFNSSGANMVMYWHLLCRAIDRGQSMFDFGRSTIGGGTYKFKEQWGALPEPAVWQYHVRRGSASQMRPESGKFGLAIRVWQRLPLWLANLVGPAIVRGIP
jgi:FemAB-related protein (PEP-CTERM system-associated)